MPPKSSNKKNSNAFWYFCEKCSVHITSKVRDTHEKVCPIADGAATANDKTPLEYIREGALYTSELKKLTIDVEELKEIPTKFSHNLIFLSEGAIRLAGFHIGQDVQITATSTDGELATMVRSIWPLSEKFLTTVFVMSADFDTNWQQFTESNICIKVLPKNSISLAKSVCLQLTCKDEESFTPAQMNDALRLLKIEKKDLIFTEANYIYFNFFNKDLRFQVKSWNDLNEIATCQEFENLESSFAKLKLEKSRDYRFFRIAPCTHLEFISEQKLKRDDITPNSTTTKTLIGGLDEQFLIVEEAMKLALGQWAAPRGIQISRGILLYGSSGCGKTMICDAMSRLALESFKAQIIRINASEIFSKFLGETEKNLSAFFEKAYQNYPQPNLIIVEDVNNLCPKNETNDISRRVSLAFASMLDVLNTRTEARSTFLLATTSDIEAVCPSLRRCGRLDTEIEIGAPAPKARAEILHCALQNVEHDLSDDEIKDIAQNTHGFVGADLINLVSHATLAAHTKNGRHRINHSDMLGALTHVKPSAMREVLIENPNVHWTDIGGQAELKLQLKQAIEWPLLYPEKFQRLGIKPPRGILMYGPPGCSKTMIAKALATESQLNFLSIKGPELFSMWVGESERAVREVFRKARQVAPAIVFFDEIDAIGGERAEGSNGGSSVQERVLTQLLTELDGVEALQNVTIVAATNRPDMIDKALLRPGRIDRIVYVGLPDAAARREIFRIKLSAMPLAADVDIELLVQRTEQYTGAEIQAICHEAALKTLEEDLESVCVNWRHFEHALSNVKPRTNPELLRLYEEYAKRH